MPRIGSVLAATLLATAPSAFAQLLPHLTGQPTPPGEPHAYGTSAQTIYTVGSFDMEATDSSATYAFVNMTTQRYLTNSGIFVAALHLPSGALIEKFELEGCDTASDGEVVAALALEASPGGMVETLGLVESGTLFDAGCALFPQTLASPVTVDNKTRTYFVVAQNNTFEGKTSFAAVRVYYRLQVSPAPATATFADVPTSYIYFRAIEALAAAGITSGCGNGNFCPTQPVTRGELAKFLANALGLHWPN